MLPTVTDLVSTTNIPNDCCFTYETYAVLPQEYTTDGSQLEVAVPFFTLAENFTCDEVPILYTYTGSSISQDGVSQLPLPIFGTFSTSSTQNSVAF